MKICQGPQGILPDGPQSARLFRVCWAAYYVAYLGRLNYAACLVAIVADRGWGKGQAGLIGTGFFAAYGISQLISGFVGDRVSPKYMVAVGLGFSGILNLIFPLMTHPVPAVCIWCINGVFQSMLWSPLVRLCSEWLPPDRRLSACINMNSTSPLGTLSVYALSAIFVFLHHWSLMFYVGGIVLVGMTILWLYTLNQLEKGLLPVPQENASPYPEQNSSRPILRIVFANALPLCCFALILQGMLKDGITTWVPSFMEEQFHFPAATAILCTMIVPLINLSGIFIASALNRRCFHNELKGAFVFFLAGASALALLSVLFHSSAPFSLFLLAFITTSMTAVNTMLVSMLPPYYVHFGLCSSVSGILNAAANVGCAFSMYGNGALVDLLGWGSVIRVWCILAVIGAALCFPAIKKWKRFRSSFTNH